MSKIPEYLQYIALKRTRPQNHVNCIKMVKIAVILANFSIPQTLQSGNYKISVRFYLTYLLWILYFIFTAVAAVLIPAFSPFLSLCSPFFPMCNVLWDSVVTKTVGFTLGFALFN